MKWFAMSRLFRLGSILKFAVPAALALSAGAFWAGVQWQSGRVAQEQLKVVRADQADAAVLAAHQHQEAAGYEQRRQDRRGIGRSADRDLREWLEAHPHLWDCDVGVDGMRHIRRWIGIGADATGEPAGAVPDSAASARQRQGAAPADDDEGMD